jgi:glycosyl hydrolase family 26/carbohydrate binding protein with CBM35 domain/cellulose binding protein with CBM2 domain
VVVVRAASAPAGPARLALKLRLTCPKPVDRGSILRLLSGVKHPAMGLQIWTSASRLLILDSRAVRPTEAVSMRRATVWLVAVLLGLGQLVAPAYGAADPLVFEAEDGALNGVQVESAREGFSGTGYVGGFDTGTDSVTITVPDAPAGLYELRIRYSAPFGQKNTTLQLNGAGHGQVTLTPSDTFTYVDAGRVLLRAGANTVTFVSNWGWYLIDAIELTPAPPRPPHQVTGELVDPDATAEAKGLMRYLAAHYGTDVISGQQAMDSIQWVEENVGKAPAIAGLDMMDYSPSRVERGATSQEVEHALNWDRRGGIVTFVWHWNAPSGLIDEPGGKEWWRGFYTEATTFDLAAALADKTSADYGLLIRDIDAIAVQLKRLRDAGVPVLWRPLHEAEGGWFWWGAKGPGPAKELYRLMYDRLTHHHDLHNLIWVWSSLSPDWYPGHDVVDVLGYDSYPTAGDHGPVSTQYEQLVALGGDKKLVALSEVGTTPDPELMRAYQAHWSYFVPWGGFVQDPVAHPLEFLRRIYHHDPHVITLDELGDFKNTGSCSVAVSVRDWGTAFVARVTLTNNRTTPINDWTLRFAFPGQQKITNFWNSRITQTGPAVTVQNVAWNRTIPANGGTVTFGFQAAYTGENSLPETFTLNNALCVKADR